jgi:hypothetical protein
MFASQKAPNSLADEDRDSGERTMGVAVNAGDHHGGGSRMLTSAEKIFAQNYPSQTRTANTVAPGTAKPLTQSGPGLMRGLALVLSRSCIKEGQP